MVTFASFMGVRWPCEVEDYGDQRRQERDGSPRPDSPTIGRSDSSLTRDLPYRGSGR